MTALVSPETVLIERSGRVGIVTLNRPDALNSLNTKLIAELTAALAAFDRDNEIGCHLIRGSAKSFAAGADIKEMLPLDFAKVYDSDWFSGLDAITKLRKPVVAAVSGYALGGGCELVMMCDVVIASETAKFGQPEIKLGTIPGIGGTQRLTRAVGKAKAMELCLTGRLMDAAEAERAGLVSRVTPADQLEAEALATATTIAGMSIPVTMMAKEAVNAAYETTLTEGVKFERRLFFSTFALNDRAEGMAAFSEKRKPIFAHR